ncbi:2OG-Fe dioxygenase family protein [Kovacikia minuta CCNUW1]|uniref:2OG-Fe dioxygenase family protein n=1 Tax=Kovacikia minuta TaxID=2931930 RepID=UPI001CCD418A|nr:2OG-Fe dioxygenase family protein [Kovacikia minuta]UBF26185.1 2OG-Fe dioxygenase family protein [Kovacikia minuta CCNUW1]
MKRSLLETKEAKCSINYILQNLNSIRVETLAPYFQNLPIDPYIKDNYRFRRFSNFKVCDQHLVQLPHAKFFQSKTYNPLLGDVTREYGELDDGLVQLKDFQTLVLEFFEFCKRCSTFTDIGVHQIRITADPQQKGNPAPEGIHRDGVDLVGIFCVGRQDLEGGETELYKSTHLPLNRTRDLAFTKILNPGELLTFSDHRFFHFTTPVHAASSEIGSRDVFVLTCPALPFLKE